MDAEWPMFTATGAVCSLPELTRGRRRAGFLNAAPDTDGILRRVPLLIQLGDGASTRASRWPPWRP